jgi:hypothetical protein
MMPFLRLGGQILTTFGVMGAAPFTSCPLDMIRNCSSPSRPMRITPSRMIYCSLEPPMHSEFLISLPPSKRGLPFAFTVSIGTAFKRRVKSVLDRPTSPRCGVPSHPLKCRFVSLDTKIATAIQCVALKIFGSDSERVSYFSSPTEMLQRTSSLLSKRPIRERMAVACRSTLLRGEIPTLIASNRCWKDSLIRLILWQQGLPPFSLLWL